VQTNCGGEVGGGFAKAGERWEGGFAKV